MKVVSLENLTKYNELLSQKTVRSVNSVKPDSDGNVQLGTEKSTFNKVVYDTGYFSIGTAQTYSFDLTGSDLENVSKENVNIRLVAKVTTAHKGFEVGDVAQISTTFDVIDKISSVDVCAFISGNTLRIRSGGDSRLSIHNGTNGGWLAKTNVQIKAVLTAFIPDDGSILLIAEDQTNTSKLIGLPDGTLTWKDKNIVRSVNGTNADANGNITITSVANATKASQDKNGAQIDTTYFKSANGTFTGNSYYRDVDNSVLRFNGGNTHDGGASLMLYGKNNNHAPGVFDLVACTKEDASNSKQLIGTPDGMLTWVNKNIVRSVNGALADANGNVEITTSGADLSGVVKSINNIQPDENGNISLNVFTTPGNIIKWETDYFDIAPSGLYSFDLSNTPFANIPREAINIQMVGKVKTAQSRFKVDDYVYPQFTNYNGNTSRSEVGSTPYISGNVLSIKFGDDGWFVSATPNGTALGLAKTNVKVKLILTALIEEV